MPANMLRKRAYAPEHQQAAARKILKAWRSRARPYKSMNYGRMRPQRELTLVDNMAYSD